MNVLVVDIGGSGVKVAASSTAERCRFRSGRAMTPDLLMRQVLDVARGWRYEAIAIGYPGVVANNTPVKEPGNLACGWISFDFERAFRRPVRVVNDAVMQALGAYEGGRMLFLGLGTGLGSALILDGLLEPMELAHLPYKKGRTYEDYVGQRGLERLGKKKWRQSVADVVDRLKTALEVDYVVLGGGNARKLKELPPATQLGGNANAFTGGFRLWEQPAAGPKAAPAP